MAFNIKDRATQLNLERNVERATKRVSDSLEKLSSGSAFSKQDPRPAERALAEGLEFKLRSLASSKSNVNMAVTFLQTAESGLSEITNMILRMKEINVAAANTTLSDKERKFLFVEYEALHDEINRVALTTEFNGIPLLNGEDPRSPETLIFRVGDPSLPEGDVEIEGDDVNVLRFDGVKQVVATTFALGIKSARDLLADGGESGDGGISVNDVEEMLLPEDDSEEFSTAYDYALNTIATQRAVFGGMQARLHRAADFIDVYQENISAAKSNIADVDYAREVSNLVESRILAQASTSLLAQGSIQAQLAFNLINSI